MKAERFREVCPMLEYEHIFLNAAEQRLCPNGTPPQAGVPVTVAERMGRQPGGPMRYRHSVLHNPKYSSSFRSSEKATHCVTN